MALDNPWVLDMFTNKVRWLFSGLFTGVGVLLIPHAGWTPSLILWPLSIVCLLNRHRMAFDFEKRTIKDERGLVGFRQFPELSFDAVDRIEIGLALTRSRRSYHANLYYRDDLRPRIMLAYDLGLQEAVSVASNLAERGGFRITFSSELHEVKDQMDSLFRQRQSKEEPD